MDRIDLPFVPGDVPLAEVFDRMADAGVHAAIVAIPAQEPILVTNLDVDEGLERGLERVSQIRGRPLHVVQAEVADWETALDDASAGYGMVAAGAREFSVAGGEADFEGEATPQGLVTIVTRHETLAADIRNAGEVCRCQRFKHRAPRGRPCPFCSSVVRCA